MLRERLACERGGKVQMGSVAADVGEAAVLIHVTLPTPVMEIMYITTRFLRSYGY